MKRIWAHKALLPHGWAENVLVSVGHDGRIADIASSTPIQGHSCGILLPAPVNVHSHSFQRAMAGLTEQRGPKASDNFWTWRKLMFRFLERLTPEHVEAIAAFVQMEMLEAGYTTNAEFHYLHHHPDGTPYDDIAEMANRIAAASLQSGIGLCLLPVHYEFGGCDGRPLSAGQKRFGNTFDQFQDLQNAAITAFSELPDDGTYGVAPHSLRAVGSDTLKAYGNAFPNGPIHMHLAEQRQEVDEVLSLWNARPVEWALENMELQDRWCLIHCTQMTAKETQRLAATGAVGGLCPITESSLGDGIFDGVRWLDAGGKIAIGSDSNIRISLSEELRTLEYSQRLRDGTRAALASPELSTGRRIFDAIIDGGVQATNRTSGALRVGNWADLLSLDHLSINLAERKGDAVLDAWIFAGDDRLVTDVWSAGRHLVHDGQHIRRDSIVGRYRKVITELKDAL
ncbi:MAG: formimidoylglutamate deiminase [Boseongicola sp.]|nr:MAG: formimidoylglutamate deiminase [Boseongicola sp.]